jgi:UDP-3-O-[3-hydroxymyristoyl] glucosamine N-acyltransferase
MKLNPPQTVTQLAQLIHASVVGPPDHLVTGINEIHRVEPGDLTFVDVAKYYKKALGSKATTILINKEVEAPAGKALIVTDDPFRDFNLLTEHFQPRAPLDTVGKPQLGKNVRIGQSVVFGNNVVVGDKVEIAHNVTIGSNVTIGEGTLIYSNVTLYDHTTIGRQCCIQSGARIGGEAFYFKKRENGRDKMLSKGITVLEDFVEVGANTTIDRGVSAETRIGEHTKIDNLVQIGHDTLVGKRCVIAAQVGIAGVTTVEDDVILWGQVGIPSDVTIGKGAILMAKTGVLSSLAGGKVYSGMPANEKIRTLRRYATLDKLVGLIHKIERL